LIALVPAIVLAGLAAFSLSRIAQLFRGVQPITLSVLGQEILRIDLLSSLGLQSTARTVSELAANLPITFLLFSLFFLVFGGLLFAFTWFLSSAAYNLLARIGGGLEVDLQEAKSVIDSNQGVL
jgi:hypothetical protein